MKKIFIMLLLNGLLIHTLSSQTLLQQIENTYNALDSVFYIDNVILSYKEDKLKLIKETENLMLELRRVYNNMDSVQRQQTLDSVMEIYNTMELSYREDLTKKKVWEKIHSTFAKQIANAYLNLDGSIQRQNTYDSISKDFSKILLERDYSMFISAIKDKPVHYVLNLIPQDNQTLQVDTGKLAFNIFYFDKDYKGSLYVYCTDGRYSWYDTRYRAFSRQIGENAPKVFIKIMQKRPKYLLYSSELEGMNTILYVLNDKIFVYRIVQMKEYELSDYIEKFGIVKK